MLLSFSYPLLIAFTLHEPVSHPTDLNNLDLLELLLPWKEHVPPGVSSKTLKLYTNPEVPGESTS